MALGVISLFYDDVELASFEHDLPAGESVKLERNGQVLSVVLSFDGKVAVEDGEGPEPQKARDEALEVTGELGDQGPAHVHPVDSPIGQGEQLGQTGPEHEHAGAAAEGSEDLSELTKAELQALADERDLPRSGTKAELIERLSA